MKNLFLNTLISAAIVIGGRSALGQVIDSQLNDVFARTASFSFGSALEFPRVQVFVGKTAAHPACVVTHVLGAKTLTMEVLGMDALGAVATEPLGFELSTRRKYTSLVLSVEDQATKGELRLHSLQSLGSTAKVSYEIQMKKWGGQLSEFRLAYQNRSGRMESKTFGGEALGCSRLKPLMMISSRELAARATQARRAFEASQKDRLGSYLPEVTPRCALESNQLFSCEFAYQSPRVPDYLKVTYAIGATGLGRVVNIEFTRGH